MRTSIEGIRFVEDVEGKRNKVYKDTKGLPTIGVGHLLTKDELSSGKILINGERVKYAEGLTDAQVEQLLQQDLSDAEGSITAGVAVPLTQNQFDALVSFTFNVGRRAFLDSTLLKLLNGGNYDAIPTQLLRWCHDGQGNTVAGLLTRRKREVALFIGN